MKRIFLAAVVATFAMGTVGTAFAQETCETKAVGKDGKALAGAAKTSFVKKCKVDSCATKAVSADGNYNINLALEGQLFALAFPPRCAAQSGELQQRFISRRLE